MLTSPIVIPAGQNVIIDLNGKKIIKQTSSTPIIVLENARVLVKNGTIVPEKNWGTAQGDNATIEWYNLNVGRGEMNKNSKTPKSQFYLDGSPK